MKGFLIALLATTLPPLLIAWWGRMFPVDEIFGYERSFESLKKRNNAIYLWSCAFCMVGLCAPIAVLKFIPEEVHIWVIGLCFGSMIILPVLFIALVTLPFGLARFYEFWRFYELNYKIGIKGIMALYIPIAMLGLISAYEINKSI